jgi:formate hydrogenlyase subunit 3
VVLLVAGMITAFVGGLYALMEHNIQRLLAYHTLENIGIILLGMGAGTGLALNQPALIAAGFIGGLYHLSTTACLKARCSSARAASGSAPAIAISKSWAGLAKKCR